jgi:hypothetical protein
MTQVATPGRIVMYTLSDHDAEQINRRRSDAARERAGQAQSGYVVHVGNEARAGDMLPAFVVRTFGGPSVNLQVLLDGNDTYWATSRGETDADAREQGKWFWPTRA